MRPPAPIVPRKKRVTKDPTVDTHFLPDKHRDEERAREKERLAREWLQEQERVKGTRVAAPSACRALAHMA